QPVTESSVRGIEDGCVIYIGRRFAFRRHPCRHDNDRGEENRPEERRDQKPLRSHTLEVLALDDRPELSHVRSSFLDAARPLARSGQAGIRADFLEEYLEKRRLDHLESLNGGPRFNDPTEQHLRISTGRQLDLEKPVGIVSALHKRAIAQDRRYPSHSITIEREGNVPLPVLFLDASHGSVEHLLASRDDAD